MSTALEHENMIQEKAKRTELRVGFRVADAW